MTILAIDTTSQVASVAIRSEGQTLAETVVESTDGFAHLIFAAVEKCTNEAKIAFAEIDCFAAASGPGSFTGVRVGLSVIKGLATALDKPVAGVSNLRALSSFGKNPVLLRAVVIDARRSEVYAAVYNAGLELVGAEIALPFRAWLDQLDPAAHYEFISPLNLALENTQYATVSVVEPPGALAAAVALCAEYDGHQGKWLDPAALDANYVRRADAESAWQDR